MADLVDRVNNRKANVAKVKMRIPIVLDDDLFVMKKRDRLSEFAILYFRFFEESGSKGFKRTKAATLTSLLSS
jgi:hypothetical protein